MKLSRDEILNYLENVQKKCKRTECKNCDFGIKYGEEYYCELGEKLISETPDTWNLD